MDLTKENLEELYRSMSIDEMAGHLKMAKSTLYYYMRKLGVARRSKSEAQQRHLSHSPHQRLGKNHSEQTKTRIADGTKRFWESNEGEEQKKRLGELRREEWRQQSPRQRSVVLNRLQSAARPAPGELSHFGAKLAEFLSEHETVKTGIRLTPRHISDIILEDRRVVIELLLPISVYGDKQAQKMAERYDRLTLELQDAGYRVVIIEDRSNSLSKARCERVYQKLLKFFTDTKLRKMTIVS